MAAVVILLLLVGAFLVFFGFAKRAPAAVTSNGTKSGAFTTAETRTPALRPPVAAPAPAKINQPVSITEPVTVAAPVLSPAPAPTVATPTAEQAARLARDPSIEFFTFEGRTDVGGIRLRQ